MAVIPAGGSPPGGTDRRASKPRHMGAPVGRILLLRLHRPSQGAREFSMAAHMRQTPGYALGPRVPLSGVSTGGRHHAERGSDNCSRSGFAGPRPGHGRSEARKEPTTRLVPPRGAVWTGSDSTSAADDALLHRGRPTSQRWCRRWGSLEPGTRRLTLRAPTHATCPGWRGGRVALETRRRAGGPNGARSNNS